MIALDKYGFVLPRRTDPFQLDARTQTISGLITGVTYSAGVELTWLGTVVACGEVEFVATRGHQGPVTVPVRAVPVLVLRFKWPSGGRQAGSIAGRAFLLTSRRPLHDPDAPILAARGIVAAQGQVENGTCALALRGLKAGEYRIAAWGGGWSASAPISLDGSGTLYRERVLSVEPRPTLEVVLRGTTLPVECVYVPTSEGLVCADYVPGLKHGTGTAVIWHEHAGGVALDVALSRDGPKELVVVMKDAPLAKLIDLRGQRRRVVADFSGTKRVWFDARSVLTARGIAGDRWGGPEARRSGVRLQVGLQRTNGHLVWLNTNEYGFWRPLRGEGAKETVVVDPRTAYRAAIVENGVVVATVPLVVDEKAGLLRPSR